MVFYPLAPLDHLVVTTAGMDEKKVEVDVKVWGLQSTWTNTASGFDISKSEERGGKEVGRNNEGKGGKTQKKGQAKENKDENRYRQEL